MGSNNGNKSNQHKRPEVCKGLLACACPQKAYAERKLNVKNTQGVEGLASQL